MWKVLYSWRYYKLGREQYQECMNKIFINNLYSLRQAATVITIFTGSFSLFPLLFERNFFTAGVYIFTAVVSLLISIYTNYIMQKEYVNNRVIYILITLFYINIMTFGMYLSVWSTPDKLASIFLCFLICALLMFITPPLYNFSLTLGAMIIFIISTIIVKSPDNFIFDIVNTLIAGAISLYFVWMIPKWRLELELSANMLEEERNKYYDQSIIDELTQLRNRRDFMQTFKRYLVNYRTTDDWLCIAIMDIDFFKFYNDNYGHPKGDECLRSVGGVLNSLKENLGVYAARVGGEEFALLWFEQDTAHVDTVVSHITGLISDLKIPHEKSKVAPYVTLSIGVYVERCGASNDVKALYDLADKALYTAKEGGRNCAVVHGDEIKEYKITPAS